MTTSNTISFLKTGRLFNWFIAFFLFCQSACCWSLSSIPSGAGTTGIVSGYFSGSPEFPGFAVTNSGVLGGSQLIIYLNNNGTLAPIQSPFTLSMNTLALVAAGNFQRTQSVADLAVLLQRDRAILIFLNNGSGIFQQQSIPLTTELGCVSIAIGNFNGNGKGDIVVANSKSATLSIFFSNGDGTFAPPQTIVLPSMPFSVAAGDLNGDGIDDIAVTLGAANQVAVYINNGSGQFTPSGTYAVGSGPCGISIGTLTDSGFNDIIAASTVDNQICVLKNKGAAAPGQFLNGTCYATEYAPIGVAIADFAGNGKQSVAVTCEASSTVNLFVNNGNGALQFPLSYPTPSAPVGIAAGTFSGNNIFSYLVACFLNGTVDPVSALPTTTTLTQSSTTSNPGELVTFTANVATSGTPTGNVSFSIDGGVGTIVPLSPANTALFSTSSLSSGSHTVTATYLGDATFFPSSASVTHLVLTPSTITINSSVNPSNFCETVTFSGTVSGPAGFPIPTGSVTFSIDGTQVITLPLNNAGQVSYSTSALTVGTHSITASYSGDSNYLPSTTATPLVQTVNRQTTSLEITSSANPSTIGQLITISATVRSPSGCSTPTGNVAFVIDGTQVSVLPLNNAGQVSYSTSALTAGTHIITASYSGDGNYLPSTTATPLTQTVNRQTTSLEITSSANPSTFGQLITISATARSPSGSSTPTGTMVFVIDGTQVSVLPLNNAGQASYSTSNLSLGAHEVTASYSGDDNYLPSSSSLTQVVQPVIHPPTHVKGIQELNRFATQKDIVNRISWRAPSSGSKPVKYRIYRNPDLTHLAAVIRAPHTKFYDHNRHEDRAYTYYIVSVDASGMQSEAVSITVKPR